MRKWLRKSFARQVSLLLLASVALLVSAYAYLDYQETREQWRHIAQTQAREVTQFIALTIADDVRYGRHFEIWNKLKGLQEGHNQPTSDGILYRLREIAVLDSADNVIGHTDPIKHPLKRPYDGPLLQGRTNGATHDDVRLIPIGRHKNHDPPGFITQTAIRFGGEEIGILLVDFDTSPLAELINQILHRYLTSLPGAMLGTLLFALGFTRWVTRPLGQVTGVLTSLGAGNVKLPTLTSRQDEYQQLGRAIEFADQRIHDDREELRAQRNHLIDTQTELTRFKTTLDRTLDSVFMFDADSLRFFYANRGAAKQLGYLAHDLLHMTPVELDPASDDTQFRQRIAPLVRHERDSITYETLYRHRDGSLIPVEVFLQHIVTSGESPRFVAFVRDITGRKRSEQILRRSEARLAAAQRIAHLGHWEWEIGTDTFYCSDETYRIFGLKPGAFAPTYGKFLERVHPRDRAALSRTLDETITTNIPCSIEHRIIHPDGTERVVQEIAEVTRTGGGTPLRMLGTIQDITERKKVERMKDEFISTVSHELRTPLTSIRGSLGLLIGGAVGEFSSQATSLLTIANKNTERLLLLINDILDISKIESGTVRLHLRPVAVTPFLEQVIAANETYAAEYGIAFENKSQLNDAWVLGDANRLTQVMNNLMSNAAKFSPAGSQVHINAARNGYFIRISVTDHGPGIPQEFRPHLFDKFTQSDSSDTRQVGGTGLGMSIAKALVERHGGSIGFVTDNNVGTTFYFDLPAWYEPGLGTMPPQEIEAHGNWRNRLLICEDEPDIAALLRMILVQSGYDADVAHDADEARKLLTENRYNAMTLDIMLPGEDGISLLRELREQPQTMHLPVIIVSAKAADGKHTVNGGALGVVDWIEKPVDEERLLSVVSGITKPGKELPRILHVEDDPDICHIVTALLKGKAEVVRAPTVRDANRRLNDERFGLILLDMALPDGSGVELLNNARSTLPPVVVFSAKEVDKETARRVSATLVKSRISDKDLVDTILRLASQTA